MPIYNEDPARTMSALRAMAEALRELGAHASFEIVVISDSTNADAWIRETLSIERLRAALIDIMPVWYRRRWKNVARKSGNVEDFVTRWGGRYDHMIVLDADSLIDAGTLSTLVRMMEADPSLGILQTAPAADRRAQLLRPPAAVRRLRLRPGHLARPRRLVGRLAATTGATTPSSAWPPLPRTAACRTSRAASRSAATSCRTISSRPR